MSDQTPTKRAHVFGHECYFTEEADALIATLTARCEALEDQLGTAEGTIELLKRRARQAEQRSEVLEAALEAVNAFLGHIEWNDTTAEEDAADLRHQIEVALSTPR